MGASYSDEMKTELFPHRRNLMNACSFEEKHHNYGILQLRLPAERRVTNCHGPKPRQNSSMPSVGLHFTHDSICKSVSLVSPPLWPAQGHTLLEKQTKPQNSAAGDPNVHILPVFKGNPKGLRMHLNIPAGSQHYGHWLAKASLGD